MGRLNRIVIAVLVVGIDDGGGVRADGTAVHGGEPVRSHHARQHSRQRE